MSVMVSCGWEKCGCMVMIWLGAMTQLENWAQKVTRTQFHKITISPVVIFIHSLIRSLSSAIGPGAGGTEINKTVSLSLKSLLSTVERVRGMWHQIRGWNRGGQFFLGVRQPLELGLIPGAKGVPDWGGWRDRVNDEESTHHIWKAAKLPTAGFQNEEIPSKDGVAKSRKIPLRIWDMRREARWPFGWRERKWQLAALRSDSGDKGDRWMGGMLRGS